MPQKITKRSASPVVSLPEEFANFFVHLENNAMSVDSKSFPTAVEEFTIQVVLHLNIQKKMLLKLSKGKHKPFVTIKEES